MKHQCDIHIWRKVVQQFFLTPVSSMTFEESSAGFSGAKILRVSADGEVYALRGWPIPSLPRQRILELHHFLNFLKSHELPVAQPLNGRLNHETLIEEGGFLWQVEPWLSGSSRDGSTLTLTERQSVMQTLAQVHLVSSRYFASDPGQKWFGTRNTTVPAISERLSMMEKWGVSRVQKSRNALASAPTELRDLCKSILKLYEQKSRSIVRELQQLSSVTGPMFPCWRDLWRDHILFDNGNVTGFIDASAARLDHIGTDLSRLLGSFFEDDKEQWQLALKEYSEIRQLTAIDAAVINVLDRSSVLLSGMTWIQRWEQGSIPENKIVAVVERLIVFERRMNRL